MEKINDYNKPIKSVVEFIERIKSIENVYKISNIESDEIKNTRFEFVNKNSDNAIEQSDIELFFRGQSNEVWNLEPSIYRDNTLKEKEADIINKVLADRHLDFKDCNNTFEVLIKMQHYGIPTRILDLTGNLLQALYFACEDSSNKDKNGAIFMFMANKEQIKTENEVKGLINESKISLDSSYCDNKNLEKISTFIIFKTLSYIVYVLSLGKDNFVDTLPRFCESNPIEMLIILMVRKLSEVEVYSEDFNIKIKYLINLYKIKSKRVVSTNQDRVFLKSMEVLLEKLEYDKIQVRNGKAHNRIDVISGTKEEQSKHKLFFKDILIKADQFLEDIKEYEKMLSCEVCSTSKDCIKTLENSVFSEFGYKENINVKDLVNWQLVRGVKNNERILVQDGHFIIVPNDIIKKQTLININKESIFNLPKKNFNEYGFEIKKEFKDLGVDKLHFGFKMTVSQSSPKDDVETGRWCYKNIINRIFKSGEEEFEKFSLDIYNEQPNIHKIIIDKDSKNNILKELKLLGITHSTVYLELESYSKYLNKELYDTYSESCI